MGKLEKANEIMVLSGIVQNLQEKKNRIIGLNKYDHEEEDGVRPFFIEFGGGSVHTKYFIEDNDIGNRIEAFFCALFDEDIRAAELRLDELIA